MSKHDWKILFEDILEAINKIEDYTTGINLQSFKSNSMLLDAVVRNIEIIGEASSKIPDEIKIKFAEIPWVKLKGIRNRIVHDYFGVDAEIIWVVIEKDLFELKKLIALALKK
ncbi:MAG TPA: DUF86 domain-containing protein [Ignavibacteriaceae bacterium]|nr:DUF86 domain-containing protein [Ignavibacteriaceae bacterium]